MNGIIRMSEAATLGLHALAYIALVSGKRLVSAREISKALNISAAHLAKVMQKLERTGIVKSKRGPSGGFVLNHHPQQLSLKAIYEAVEGPSQQAVCLLGKEVCSAECPLGSLMKNSAAQLHTKLENIKLSDFAKHCGMKALEL